MKMTDKQIHLLAQLSRNRGLYAECKGADLDALQELGLLEWFDARSSTTPFSNKIPVHYRNCIGISDRIDYCLGCSCRKLARGCRARSLC